MHAFTALFSSSADFSENINLWVVVVDVRVEVVVSLRVVVVTVHNTSGIDP